MPDSALPEVRLCDSADPAAPGASLAVAVHPGPVADDLPAGVDVDLQALLEREAAKGEPGEVVSVPGPTSTLLAFGVGDASPAALRKAGAALARRARAAPLHVRAVSDLAADGLTAFVEGLLLGSYSFSRKTGDDTTDDDGAGRALTLAVADPDALRPAFDRARAVSTAVALARDLANTPSLEKTPDWLARRSAAVAESAGLRATVWDEQQLAQDGFGGILAVGMGSVRPPRLVQLEYRPARATRHVVLVGKGITFDSGGLSIKTSDGMTTMKTDMAGAAAVIATMSALTGLGCGPRVTALLPMAENMPSGTAQRPGDVIRHWGGTTTEVFNTDAEGRLVLADALAYATARLKPDVVVDLATLTGAATLGLGRGHAALYATDAELAAELLLAADRSGDAAWQLPLVEDYRHALDSDVADLRNVADPGLHYQGGSITAALFLREFTGGCRWAHFDIAGPARADKDQDELSKGATGWGVRLLLSWLCPR